MTRIVTDTASDITRAEAERLEIDIVSLGIHFDEQPYHQLEDEDFSEFYERLEGCKNLPKTSQPPPEDYLQIFEQAKATGDDVVVVCLSSALSGTYQSACIARDISGHAGVYVIDGRTAVMAQRLLVEYAVRLRAAGTPAAEIAAILQDAVPRLVVFGALDTLKYLRKGGRIPKRAELVGSMLNIKPLVTLNPEGLIEMAGKARGYAGSVTGMVKLIEGRPGFDLLAPVYFGYSEDPAPCKKFQKIVEARYGLSKDAVRRCAVGGTIGTHVGPGVIAIAYLQK